MTRLVLTEEQLRQLTAAGCRATLVDPQGNVIGVATPPLFSVAEIADAKRRLAADEPEYSVAEKNVHIARLLTEFQESEHAV